MQEQKILLQVEDVHKSFEIDDSHSLKVLEDISLNLHANEIISFLGKSGTGKSTLLRIIAGLIPPSRGKVICMGEKVTEPSYHMSMVFQNFALMPWLTVFDNVALGLEALFYEKKQIKEITQNMIDLIGLGGYENAYPKELSGGMKQRVGLARALAIEPQILLLDEPFSALDIYTSNKIKTDLINLWESRQIKTSSMILVTHNIEEAVIMSDRILVWDSNPGRIAEEFIVDIPRDKRTKRGVLDLVETITDRHHDHIANAEKKLVKTKLSS